MSDIILSNVTKSFDKEEHVLNNINYTFETGKSYGTPHDLAALYGKGRMVSDPGNVPAGYNKDVKLGRPEEKVTNINTQDNALGRDRLGRQIGRAHV